MSRDVGRSEILEGRGAFTPPAPHAAFDIPDERKRGAGMSEIFLGHAYLWGGHNLSPPPSLIIIGLNYLPKNCGTSPHVPMRSDDPAFEDEALTLKQVHSLNVSLLGTILK